MTSRELIFVKGALAALQQNAQYPADIKAAQMWLKQAIAEHESALALTETKAVVEAEAPTQ